MEIEFELDGRDYHENKGQFKKIMKKYGIKWAGTFENFKWTSPNVEVRAQFDRDEAEDTTKRALIVIKFDKRTDAVDELEEWANKMGAKVANEMKLREIDNKWEARINYHKAEGAPESWIGMLKNKWKEERSQYGG